MKDASMGRNEMVDRLAAHTAAAVSSDPDIDWLRFILRHGFIGYEHMSKTQLQNELERYGLVESVFDGREEDCGEPRYGGELADERAM
jgi:hypothetical protein